MAMGGGRSSAISTSNQPYSPKVRHEMAMIKQLARTKSFWILILVAILGGISAAFPFWWLGIAIAVLTILGIIVQGIESLLAQREETMKREAREAYLYSRTEEGRIKSNLEQMRASMHMQKKRGTP